MGGPFFAAAKGGFIDDRKTTGARAHVAYRSSRNPPSLREDGPPVSNKDAFVVDVPLDHEQHGEGAEQPGPERAVYAIQLGSGEDFARCDVEILVRCDE